MWMDVQMDRHDEANSRFSQFCECVKMYGMFRCCDYVASGYCVTKRESTL
jgi:hypothetical protein